MDGRRLKLRVAYDGGAFAGWQIQAQGERTVQGELERAAQNVFKMKVRIYGSGRTDSGVHALNQCAHIDVPPEVTIPARKVTAALNSNMPEAVRVLSCEEADEDFHARFSAKRRKYLYVIFNEEISLPFYSPYSLHIRKALDVDLLNEYAQTLVGKHDFSSFASYKDSNENKVRELFKLRFRRRGSFVLFFVEGNAFLHNMVRIITGTLLDFEKVRRPSKGLVKILHACDRKAAGTTAKPCGLFLRDVLY